MSREILFRGKRIDNGGWVYGVPFFIESEEKAFIINNCSTLYFDKNTSFKGAKIDFETIGQYTGLKDKNGVKIFEGDILNIHQTVNGVNLFVIMSCIGGYDVRYFYDGKPQREYEYSIYELLEIGIIDKELEVIGNIHNK